MAAQGIQTAFTSAHHFQHLTLKKTHPPHPFPPPKPSHSPPACHGVGIHEDGGVANVHTPAVMVVSCQEVAGERKLLLQGMVNDMYLHLLSTPKAVALIDVTYCHHLHQDTQDRSLLKDRCHIQGDSWTYC